MVKHWVYLFVGVSFSTAAYSCTTVAIPKSKAKVVAKSYDWHQGHALAVVNLSGMSKKSLVVRLRDKSAKWTSAYGSLTFNQHGREFPLGGINEKGLTTEIMWLNESQYPPWDTRETVNELQWIQYQLDNFDTVEKVVAHSGKIRVANIHAQVHYLVCDTSGACASFEYLKGKLVVHQGAALPVAALTNDPYEESARHLKGFLGFGGTQSIPSDESSLSRFVRASALAAAFDPLGALSAVDAAFNLLHSVGGTPHTKFHIVYETDRRRIHFRTRTHGKIKTVDLDHFDLECDPAKDKTQILDINQDLEGDVTRDFVAYSKAENRRMIDESFKGLEGKVPKAMASTLASFPDHMTCH